MAAHATPPLTRAEVQEKMNSLRVYFNVNKKKEKASKEPVQRRHAVDIEKAQSL